MTRNIEVVTKNGLQNQDIMKDLGIKLISLFSEDYIDWANSSVP